MNAALVKWAKETISGYRAEWDEQDWESEGSILGHCCQVGEVGGFEHGKSVNSQDKAGLILQLHYDTLPLVLATTTQEQSGAAKMLQEVGFTLVKRRKSRNTGNTISLWVWTRTGK